LLQQWAQCACHIIGTALACTLSGSIANKFALYLARKTELVREQEQSLRASAISRLLRLPRLFCGEQELTMMYLCVNTLHDFILA
jgi:hypothetical protein